MVRGSNRPNAGAVPHRDGRQQLLHTVSQTEIGMLKTLGSRLGVERSAMYLKTPSELRDLLSNLALADREVRAFDHAAWQQELEDWRAEQLTIQHEKEAAAAEKRRTDNIRLERHELVCRTVERLRWEHKEQHGSYATKGELHSMIVAGEDGWDRPTKNKDVEVSYAEVAWAWKTLDPGSFIDASKLAGSTLLWDQVKELQPLTQQPDAQGSIKYRTNNRHVRAVPNGSQPLAVVR